MRPLANTLSAGGDGGFCRGSAWSKEAVTALVGMGITLGDPLVNRYLGNKGENFEDAGALDPVLRSYYRSSSDVFALLALQDEIFESRKSKVGYMEYRVGDVWVSGRDYDLATISAHLAPCLIGLSCSLESRASGIICGGGAKGCSKKDIEALLLPALGGVTPAEIERISSFAKEISIGGL